MKSLTLSAAKNQVDRNTTLFWFRRDLRLNDNAGLYHALRENEDVLPVFIFDTVILSKLENKTDRRIGFILSALRTLKQQLEEAGSTLLVVHADPVEFFKSVRPHAVYANHDYEPYARQRDENVSKILSDHGSVLRTYKDQVIFEKREVVKRDGEPYTVFTPYSRKWKASISKSDLRSYTVTKYLHHLSKRDPLPFPAAKDIGFEETNNGIAERTIKLPVIRNYHRTRDFPAVQGTSRLSVHLRFGTVSIRRLVQIAYANNETWLNELIWREFYQMILWHFPHVEHSAFKPTYNHIPWRNDVHEFEAWCNGQTGYPIVDAGMRELNDTGFMHNRVRMVVASFLTKHLLIDWRWGEAYFASKLLDYDLAANNGGWQWAAGSGCDAAPYFRIFNPALQAQKFDPELKYICRWVPELDTPDYPKPIVAHAEARERALKQYAAALNN